MGGWANIEDYDECLAAPDRCFRNRELKGAQVELTWLGAPSSASGDNGVVYKITRGSETVAIKCFLNDVAKRNECYAAISEFLGKQKLPLDSGFLVPTFIQDGVDVRGNSYPVVKMPWVEGPVLIEHLLKTIPDGRKVLDLATQWQELMKEARKLGLAHGDLQAENIIVCDGRLKLVDYDGMFVPGLAGRKALELGHEAYQSPYRCVDDYSASLDNFSAWVIYWSLVAFGIDPKVWEEAGKGSGGRLLFQKGDFLDPENSDMISALCDHSDSRLRTLSRFAKVLIAGNWKSVPELVYSLDGKKVEIRESHKKAGTIPSVLPAINASPSGGIAARSPQRKSGGYGLKYSWLIWVPRLIVVVSMVGLVLAIVRPAQVPYGPLFLVVIASGLVLVNTCFIVALYNLEPFWPRYKKSLVAAMEAHDEFERLSRDRDSKIVVNETKRDPIRREFEQKRAKLLGKRDDIRQQTKLREKSLRDRLDEDLSVVKACLNAISEQEKESVRPVLLGCTTSDGMI